VGFSFGDVDAKFCYSNQCIGRVKERPATGFRSSRSFTKTSSTLRLNSRLGTACAGRRLRHWLPWVEGTAAHDSRRAHGLSRQAALIADSPPLPLSGPGERPVPQHLGQPAPFGVPRVRDCLDDVRYREDTATRALVGRDSRGKISDARCRHHGTVVGPGPMTLVAELEAHQRPIGAPSCDFAKARSAECRREPVIK
jgi:hypothetical protein